MSLSDLRLELLGGAPITKGAGGDLGAAGAGVLARILLVCGAY